MFFNMDVVSNKAEASLTLYQIWIQISALSNHLLLFHRLHLTKLWATTNLILNDNTVDAVGKDASMIHQPGKASSEELGNLLLCVSVNFLLWQDTTTKATIRKNLFGAYSFRGLDATTVMAGGRTAAGKQVWYWSSSWQLTTWVVTQMQWVLTGNAVGFEI